MIKKIILILISVILIIGLGIYFSCIRISYTTTHIPPITYHIKINKLTKTMSVREYNSCKDSSCNKMDVENKVKLTDEEYKIIKEKNKTSQNLEKLAACLSDLAKGDSVFMTKDQTEYDIMQDLNNDGKVTYREKALHILNDIK